MTLGVRTNPAAGRSGLHARRRFRLLVIIAVASIGSLTSAFGAPAGPLTGLRVAVSGLVLVAALTLSARVMIALDRARRRALAVHRSDPNSAS